MVDQPSSKPLSNPFGRVFAVATALAPGAVLAGAVIVLNPGAQFERGLSSAAAVEARMMAEHIPGGRSAPAAIVHRHLCRPGKEKSRTAAGASRNCDSALLQRSAARRVAQPDRQRRRVGAAARIISADHVGQGVGAVSNL